MYLDQLSCLGYWLSEKLRSGLFSSTSATGHLVSKHLLPAGSLHLASYKHYFKLPIGTSLHKQYFKYPECPLMGGRTVIFWLGSLLSLHSFPHGSFSYEDTDGFWVLGGTEGSKTYYYKGIIGHTCIYRRHLLFSNQVDRLIYMAEHFSVINCTSTKIEGLAHTNFIV